jgi:protein-tyrosine phosphatase
MSENTDISLLRDASLSPEDKLDLPHTRCNWITDNNTILIGAKPTKETIDNLLNCNIKLFVNLAEDKDSKWYKDLLPKEIEYMQKPIKNGSAPKLSDALEIYELVKQKYENNQIVYIHCNGGHGRAGTIGAFIIAKLFKLSGPESILKIEQYRENRIDKSRNFIPTPETNEQVKFLIDNLGIKENEKIPDRSNKDWLKRVKQERKNQKELENKEK